MTVVQRIWYLLAGFTVLLLALHVVQMPVAPLSRQKKENGEGGKREKKKKEFVLKQKKG